MDEIKMYLFLCSTGVGEYYVIAKDCLSALNKTEEFLNAAEYGSYEDRKVMNIKVLAENATDLRFITNKFLIV